MADNLVFFPYTAADEPLYIIHNIDIIVSVAGSNLLQSFREVSSLTTAFNLFFCSFKCSNCFGWAFVARAPNPQACATNAYLIQFDHLNQVFCSFCTFVEWKLYAGYALVSSSAQQVLKSYLFNMSRVFVVDGDHDPTAIEKIQPTYMCNLC